MPQLAANRAKVAQNHNSRKAVSTILSVLKWGKATIRPRNLTPSVPSIYLCLFHWKLRQSGVSLEFPKLEKTPQVTANRAIVAQNHNARKAVSSTLSALKWNGLYFGPEARKWAFKKFCCVHFTANQSQQEIVYTPRNCKIFPKFPEMKPKLVKITLRARRSRLLIQS